MHRLAVIGACGVAAVSLTACESSQTKSARLAKNAKASAKLTTLTAGAANADVKVKGSFVLHSDSGNAAVVQLQNTGKDSEVNVPVLIQVKDAKGAVEYKNDIEGLQPALQEMAFLAKGQTAYWVNDQVLGATAPKSVAVQVGKAKGSVAGDVPKVTLVGKPALDSDSTGAYATGEIKNESKIPQINVPVYGVSVKGGKVVAAGRAIIEKLDPAPTKKPVKYKIFFIGNPKGGTLEVSTAPTVLKEGR